MHTDPRAGPRPVRAILLGAGVTMSDHRLSAMSTVDSKLAAADQGPPMGVSGPGLIRAVLLLSKASRAVGQGQRPSREARRAMQERQRAAAQEAFPAIDAILERYGGRRIGGATVLGTVAVETTAEGIQMLKGAPAVESIMQDQPLTAIRSTRFWPFWSVCAVLGCG